ncbi:MAG: hypothetical protein KGJ78_00610 [Alphaproteobacteria bacterium]|nr:hypothetical protein [Alphaproteobacteria bacterium]
METVSACLKSIGAGVLTLIVLGGLGYYAYTALFVTPATHRADEFAAVHTSPQQAPEKVTVTGERKPS